MMQLQFTTDLGAHVTVDIAGPAALYDTLKKYGKLGWTAVTIPPRGLQFPIAAEADFDWSIIGARKVTTPEGEEVIIHRGQTYRRRELEPVAKKNLPAAIKYSRGAKATDPQAIREKSGEFEYVTLAFFRGSGKKKPQFALPAAPARQNAAD